jgi:hypothetical protein
MKHTGEHQERNRNCSVISTESLFAPCSFTLCLGTGDGLKIIVHICRWARNRSLFPLTRLLFRAHFHCGQEFNLSSSVSLLERGGGGARGRGCSLEVGA